MSFDRLQSALANWTESRLVPAVTIIGGALPLGAAELPAVAFWFEDCAQIAAGIGNEATSIMEGALAVTSEIDLADPVLNFDDESILLLSVDRLHLHLPHAPLVASSGAGSPSSSADIAVDIEGVPVAFPGDFTIDAEAGILHFKNPLPASGMLTAAYSLGKWELSTEQLKGTLHADVVGKDAADVEQLSRSLIAALRRHDIPGLRRLTPLAMTAIGCGTFADSRIRRVSYRFDYEYAEPRLPLGSGPIVRVQVSSRLPGPSGVEQFVVE